MSNYNITINQVQELVEGMSNCNLTQNQEVKSKHPGRVAAGKRLAQWNRMRKLSMAPPKIEKVTLKSLLNELSNGLRDPASVLVAMDETIRIMEEDYKTEILITLKKM